MATQRFYDGQPGPDIRRELNNFEAILDGTVAAAQDASTAATSASVKAQQWADAAPGVEVEAGKYSAKHWAARAQTTVTGGLIYRGSHSAASGAYPATPSLGDYYKISVAGTLGGVDHSVGESIIYNGTDWDKIDSTDAVTSVAGRVGAVVLTKGDVGLGNVDNTSDADKPISTATQNALNGKANTTHTHAIADVTGLQAALDGKEPTIAAGTATQYWRGDKTWRDFFTDVRAATLTGLSTATNAVVGATDTVLAAIGKLQAQVSAKFDKTGGDVAGNINFTGTGRRITGDFSSATIANRLMFQTNVVNGITSLSTVPNGTGSAGQFAAYNGSDVGNATLFDFLVNPTFARIRCLGVGSGANLPIVFHVGGAERLRIDPTTGNVLATSGALGYGIGAGGTVVQATSKFTAVTLNKPTGRITMSSAGLPAGATVSFTVNNSVVTEFDVVSVCGLQIHDWVKYGLEASVSNGVFLVHVTNRSAASLSEPLVICFSVVKGTSS